MAYKKKYPECGEYTYSLSREMWECVVCGAKIDDIEAVPAGEKNEKN